MITRISFLAIPLTLTAFIHLWNPVGFPSIHIDEAYYMSRTMHVLKGQGPQEGSLYDHPYFGQLFLASALGIIGYPHILNPSVDDVNSIKMLYLVPRVLMGILATVDTFLLYKIAEIRYDRKVALIASVLFAVMPLTWLTRRIYLDSIQLPFLLSSILFAVYYCRCAANQEYKNKKRIPGLFFKQRAIPPLLLLLLSGIFLGLAIFTKIPAFTMIPLVGFLVYTKNNNNGVKSTLNLHFRYNKNIKPLAVWFIPVILIPLIWPAYALLVGQSDKWLDGVIWQTHRQSLALGGERQTKPLIDSMYAFFKVDPLLLLLGTVGIVFTAVIKKDFFPLLWLIPFFIFEYFNGFVSLFHFIPMLPGFCLGGAILIANIFNQISKRNNVVNRTLLQAAILSAIGFFGLICTTMLITTNLTSAYFNAVTFVTQHIVNINKTDDNANHSKVTLIARGIEFFWIPKYVFSSINDYRSYWVNNNNIEKVLLVVDDPFMALKSNNDEKGKELRMIYNNTTKIASFAGSANNYNLHTYPYTSISDKQVLDSLGEKSWTRPTEIQIRANY
jgi:4-amino-4-deoxy-L-arabinose transferase-like glycosyltransferase